MTIENQRKEEIWVGQYQEWVKDFDKDFKKESRKEYLELEVKRLNRYISKQQSIINELIKAKNPKWVIDMFKNMKDCLVVVSNSFGDNAYLMPGGYAMFKGMGGYIKEPMPSNPKSVICGTNYHEKIKKLKSICYELNLLKGNKELEESNMNELIRQAKQIPISNFIEVIKGKAICPAHDDKHPSLKIYEETNTCHCWSCGFNDSVIGLVQKIHNINFKQALKLILNK